MTRNIPDKIYSLEVLRGLAALSVVFWHWQHFFYAGSNPMDFIAENQPFYKFISIIYQHGDLAVELFFCISGFIFYWLYSKKISDGVIGFLSFSINRVSRLYPLYILTFLIVAALQFLYMQSHGDYFVYQHNDLHHAILNVLMIPAWGFEYGWSFNAPVWSVSIEIMLYSIFFLVCRLGRLRILIIPFLILTSLYIFDINYKIGIGIYSFFCGAATYVIFSFILKNLGSRITLVLSAICMAIGWSCIYYEGTHNAFIITGLGFTSLLSFLVAINCEYEKVFIKFRFIGDLSYSSYLIHFPLQITFSLLVDKVGFERDIFYTPLSIILFMSILIPLSLFIHRFYEVPAQQYIRGMAFNHHSKKRIL